MRSIIRDIDGCRSRAISKRCGGGLSPACPTKLHHSRVAVRVLTAPVPAPSQDGGTFGHRANGALHVAEEPSVVLSPDPHHLEPATTHDALQLERLASHSEATSNTGSANNGSGKGGNVAEAAAGGKPAKRRSSSTFIKRREGFQPREFTAQLTQSSSVAELQQLFEYGRSHGLNSIHVATLWTRLARLVDDATAPPRSKQQRPTGGRRDAAAPAAAFPPPTPAPLDVGLVIAFAADLEAATGREVLEAMEARGLSNVVWAAAKLKPQEVSSGGAETASQAEAEEELQQQGAEGQPDGDSEAQTSTSEPADRARPVRFRGGKTALAAAAAAAEAEEAAAREAAAAGRLPSTLVSRPFLDAWAEAAGRCVSSFSMQDVSNVVWALGRLGYEPKGMLLQKLCIAALRLLPRADRPQQVSNLLLGLALLPAPAAAAQGAAARPACGYVPPLADFWPAVWRAVERVVLDQEGPNPDVQALSNCLWAVGQLVAGRPDEMPAMPSQLLSRAVFRAVQWGPRLSPQQCQDVINALPRLGFRPTEYQASKLLSLAARTLPGGDAQALSTVLLSLVYMQVRPTPGWMATFHGAFSRRLLSERHAQQSGRGGPRAPCRPEAAARLLRSLAKMHWPPPTYLDLVWAKLSREAWQLGAADIAYTVLALRSLYPAALGAGAGQQAAEAEEVEAVEEAQAAGEAPQGEPAEAVVAEEEREAQGVEGAEEGPVRERRRLSRAPPPPRELLLALRGTWTALGPEGQARVPFRARAEVTELLDAVAARGAAV